jgi:ribosomal protein S18 acetylase RimI-like enzyme
MPRNAELRLELRPARAADAPAWAALQRTIYAEGRWFVGDGAPSAEALAHRLRRLEAARSLVLLAYAAEPTVELALGGWLELHRLCPARMSHVAVLTLAVAPPFRQRGIASRLLKEAYLWARTVGVRKVQLSVREHNRAALALYEREGFELEGRERCQVFDAGNFEDNLLMAKFL